jgi:thiol-disulfide isomerase/thioredoxin
MAVVTATDADFQEALKNNNKVVVKYYADWCGSCRLFAPKYNRLSNDERFNDIVFLDVNAEKNPEARKLAGVTNLPFFAVFKDGNLVEGAATGKEEYLVEMLQKIQP